MYTFYILKDDKEKYYKGITNNLNRRFKEHCYGKTVTTKRMKNLQITYTEEYLTFAEARKRELYFKSAAGRKFLKNKMGM